MLPPGDESQPPQPAEPAVDLLMGAFPTDVLDKILAALPSRDMVRTSVLSRPWSRRWETVPGLDVELHDVSDEAGAWDSAAGFLERCAGPVGRVSIRGVPLNLCHRADAWVRAAAGKSPRSLCLALPMARTLPSLFRCDAAALAELELRCCAIPAPPDGFEGFQRLTRLDLQDVIFTGGGGNGWAQLEAMVSAAAPTLVELRLQNIAFCVDDDDGDVPVPGGWVIQAPNLRRLVLRLRTAGASGRWELGPLPKLEFARIFLNDSAEKRDYVQMFTAIANVRELHIGNVATQVAAINIFQDLLWRFENLRTLKLDANFYLPPHHLFSLSRFLQNVEIKMGQIIKSTKEGNTHYEWIYLKGNLLQRGIYKRS